MLAYVMNRGISRKEDTMQSAIYRFEFTETVVMSDVESTLQLAILGAEGLFGESRVRMDGAYSIDEQRRIIVIDARNEVGRSICQLFTGFLTREIGADAFRLRSIQEGHSTAIDAQPAAVA